MNRTVKTTRIEKKYTDKKTGLEKSITIDYAKAADRLRQFREDCPNGQIKTKPDFLGDKLMFTAFVKKDKAKEESAEATGHALATKSGDKEFEKLETLAVARALAMLGYAASGEIASAEEMERFYEYRDEKKQMAIDLLTSSGTIEELKTNFMSLGSLMAEKSVVEAKDRRKAELNEGR